MKFLFITGPSGSGKTMLAKTLALKNNIFHRPVQSTTRDKREGEVHGEDYFFRTDQEMDTLIDLDRLTALVEVEYPRRYGTEKEQLDKDRVNVLVVSNEGLNHALTQVDLQKDEVSVLTIINIDGNVTRKNRDIHKEKVLLEKQFKALRNVGMNSGINFIDLEYTFYKKYWNFPNTLIEFVTERI